VRTMPQLHPAEDKLREAEFFFMMMEKSFHAYEFKYFVSAFFSALSSSTEHNRLHSPAPRFKGCYRDLTQNVFPKSDLPRLRISKIRASADPRRVALYTLGRFFSQVARKNQVNARQFILSSGRRTRC